MSGSEATLGVSGPGRCSGERRPAWLFRVRVRERSALLSQLLRLLHKTCVDAALVAVRYELGGRLVFQASMERVGYDPCLLSKLPAAFHSRCGGVPRKLPRMRGAA
jgi:hypothetical protein